MQVVESVDVTVTCHWMATFLVSPRRGNGQLISLILMIPVEVAVWLRCCTTNSLVLLQAP
jgi:hypothetical protein